MLGLRRHEVRLEPHDPDWPQRFAAERSRILEATGLSAFQVEHVGSTSVPGLLAKPILDIDVGLVPEDDRATVVAGLVRAGYIDRGEGEGGVGRLLVREVEPDVRSVHVHVVPHGSVWWRRDLSFRDSLRSDLELRVEYAERKRELARHAADRASYREGKAPFIARALHALGLGEANAAAVRIRAAAPHEAAAIAALHVRSRAEAYPAFLPPRLVNPRSTAEREERWRTFLHDRGYGKDRFLLVAEDAGRLVGFGAAGPQRHGDPAFPAEVWSLYLLASHRRQGHGRRLLAELVRRLEPCGYGALIIWTQAANAASRAFYERLGGTYVRSRLTDPRPDRVETVGYGWSEIRVLSRA